MHTHQAGQDLNHPRGPDAARQVDGKCLAGVLVDHCEALQLPTVCTGVVDEVVSPDLAASRSRQGTGPRARQTPPGALGRDLELGLLPQPVCASCAHLHAIPGQEHLDEPVAILGVELGELAHPGQDGLVLRRQTGLVADRGPGDASAACRNDARRDRGPWQGRQPSAGPARSPFFPAISFITSSSKDRSASTFFRRLFSFSRDLRRLVSLGVIVPKRFLQT